MDALKVWGIGSGDAVFVPDFTFFSSGECPAAEGATCIFVDVDERTYNFVNMGIHSPTVNCALKKCPDDAPLYDKIGNCYSCDTKWEYMSDADIQNCNVCSNRYTDKNGEHGFVPDEKVAGLTTALVKRLKNPNSAEAAFLSEHIEGFNTAQEYDTATETFSHKVCSTAGGDTDAFIKKEGAAFYCCIYLVLVVLGLIEAFILHIICDNELEKFMGTEVSQRREYYNKHYNDVKIEIE